jgi:cytochrome P450
VDEIYASGARKRDKQAHYLGVLAGPTTKTAFGTADHDLHRIRRNAMNKFFSHAQITRLEPEITTLVQLLCDKLLSMIPPVLERRHTHAPTLWDPTPLGAIRSYT